MGELAFGPMFGRWSGQVVGVVPAWTQQYSALPEESVLYAGEEFWLAVIRSTQGVNAQQLGQRDKFPASLSLAFSTAPTMCATPHPPPQTTMIIPAIHAMHSTHTRQ